MQNTTFGSVMPRHANELGCFTSRLDPPRFAIESHVNHDVPLLCICIVMVLPVTAQDIVKSRSRAALSVAGFQALRIAAYAAGASDGAGASGAATGSSYRDHATWVNGVPALVGLLYASATNSLP